MGNRLAHSFGTRLAPSSSGSVCVSVFGGFGMAFRAESFRHDAVALVIKSLTFATARQAVAPSALCFLKIVRGQLMAALAVGSPGIEMLSVPDGVMGVLASRSPRQILQSIIRRIIVGVTGLHPFRAGTDEGFQDQNVDRAVIFPFQDDVQMTGRRLTSRPQNSSSSALRYSVAVANQPIEGPNLSGVADLVTSFISQDGSPFHGYNATPVGVM